MQSVLHYNKKGIVEKTISMQPDAIDENCPRLPHLANKLIEASTNLFFSELSISENKLIILVAIHTVILVATWTYQP